MANILTIISMAIGALITWVVSKHYYQKAGKELEVEAFELKKLNTLMLRAMESADLAKFSRDEHGNIKGMIINFSAHMSNKVKVSDVNITLE